jgi:hypothetical protein
MTKSHCLLASLLAVGLSLVANVSNASLVTYNVIQDQTTLIIVSKLTAAGGLISQTATKAVAASDQGGSDRTTYTGTINADLVPGVSIQLLSANMLADLQTLSGVPINLAPASGGAGSAPGNYAFNTKGSIVASGFFAIRNVGLSLNSGVLAINGLGQFASNTITDSAFSGVTDLGGTASTIPVAGLSATNSTAVLSTITTVGSTETIKISYRFLTNVLVDQANQVFSNTVISGNVFASRQVPEPGTLVLGGVALACLVPLGLRRRRQR